MTPGRVMMHSSVPPNTEVELKTFLLT